MNGEAEFDEVFLTDVTVPADCLLGPLHGGWQVGMATLTNERGYIGAAGISLNRRLDAMISNVEGLDGPARDSARRAMGARHRLLGDGTASGARRPRSSARCRSWGSPS